MPTYELTITDVTRYGDLFCVAGWDNANGGMIRPEPPSAKANSEVSRFWTAQYAGPNKFFAVGNVVRFDASVPPAGFPFPHATEDRIVNLGNSAVLGHCTEQQIAAHVAAGVAGDMGSAFGGHLIRTGTSKAYVPAGQPTLSLDAIEIAPEHIEFYEDNPGQKRRLRAVISEGGLTYDLSVPADAARGRFLAGGAAAVQADSNACGRVHVRLGLSRPFPAMPDSCYAQVNGLYFL